VVAATSKEFPMADKAPHVPNVINKSYEGTPFSIVATEKETKPGCWNVYVVEVFQDGNKIGEYTRSYSSFVAKTFYPFQHRGKWYALYSTDYTATRVACLENGKFEDWCGETGNSFGFCPTEFYVPKAKWALCAFYANPREGQTERTLHKFEVCTWDNHPEYEVEPLSEVSVPDPTVAHSHGTLEAGIRYAEFGFLCASHGTLEAGIRYAEFGFLCGCVWGDDSSWKIRYIDFSDLENKVMKITERFGYFELSMGLKESLVFEDSMSGKRMAIKTDIWFDGEKRETFAEESRFDEE